MKKIIPQGLLWLSLILAAPTLMAADILVKDGESIQGAVNKANTGDVILVHPGTYKESVYVDKDGITIRGVVIDLSLIHI